MADVSAQPVSITPVGTTPTSTPTSTTATGQDPLSLLTGADRDAYAALTAIFNQYGLGTLAPTILKFVQQGFGPDTIAELLQSTPEYKQRFIANDARLKAGLPVLSPKDYIATEQAYHDILQSAGLPPGFYDSPTDFTSWIAGDVSPNELNSRVKVASDMLYNTPQEARDAFYQYTGTDAGHALAYILDPKRATPMIQQKYNEAGITGAAAQQGYGLNEDQSLNLVQGGVTAGQAAQGFSTIGSFLPQAETLSNIYGTQYGLDQAVAETFNTSGAGDAAQKRRGLSSQERAAFGGSAGTNNYSVAAPSVTG